MREYAKKSESQSRTLDSNTKASRQAPIDVILQRYKQNTQRYALAEEEESLQSKFDTVQRNEIDEDELLQGKFSDTAQLLQDDGNKLLERGNEDKLRRKLAEELKIKDKGHSRHKGSYDPKGDNPEKILTNLTAPCFDPSAKHAEGMAVIQREEIDEEELLQGKFDTPATQREEIPSEGREANLMGMADNLKSGIESLSGYSMDDVKVHYNSPKPVQLQAHIASGQEQHLPHEAWHVVQQMQGRVQPTTQLQGVNVNDNEGLEKEANKMREKAILMNCCTAQLKSKQIIINPKSVVQCKPEMVKVTGLTHLVIRKKNTIYGGEEGREVSEGQILKIETDIGLRSRRGPNQEFFRDEDRERGTHIYNWIWVTHIGENDVSSENLYIREDTFELATDSLFKLGTEKLGEPKMNIPPSFVKPNEKVQNPRTRDARLGDRVSRAIFVSQDGKPSEISPHIALSVWGDRVLVSGNEDRKLLTKDRVHDNLRNFISSTILEKKGDERTRKRKKMQKKLKMSKNNTYSVGEVVNHTSMNILTQVLKDKDDLVEVVGKEGHRHGEIAIEDKLATDLSPRDKDLPRERLYQQHISGFLMDCLFCHWAHAIFNLTVGKDMGIQITSAGTHGKIPKSWKIPDWMWNQENAMKKFLKLLDDHHIRYNEGEIKKSRVINVQEKIDTKGMGAPDESESDYASEEESKIDSFNIDDI